MVSLLLNLVNIVAEGIREIKCKYGHDNKKSETCGIKYKDCEYCLEYTDVKDDFIEYKSLFCKKSYQKKFDENLKKRLLIHTNFLTMVSISLYFIVAKRFLTI